MMACMHLELWKMKREVSVPNQAKQKLYQETGYPSVWMSLEAIILHINN